MKKIITAIILFTITGTISAQRANEWRPDNRTGVSREADLLKSWPAEGPKLMWTNTELAKGHSSPSFGNNKIYITGNKGNNDILFALDINGKILWQTVIGRAFIRSNPESRSTPTVDGTMVYVSSGFGDLACIDGNSGKIIWSYKASEKHKGTYGEWGIAESLLVEGDKVFFSPGGPETMTIALDKKTGELIWKSAGLNNKPSYVSPIIVDHSGRRMLINVSLENVFGVDVQTGQILWKLAHNYYDPSDELIKCVTPLYNNGMVYVTGGYNTEGMMIRLGADGKSASVVWTDKVLDVHHGGVVLVNGYIYGSNWINNGSGNWCCIDWKTGKKMWEERWQNKGSIIAADGLIYIYDERQGNVGLLNPNTTKFDLISSFKVTQGSAGPYWAHPVINNGVLYLRHMNALMAYNVKAK